MSENIALESPSMTLDSQQNVPFPLLEGRVVSAGLGSNGPIRVEDESRYVTAVDVRSVTSKSGKSNRRTFSQIFRSLRVLRPPKHTYVK